MNWQLWLMGIVAAVIAGLILRFLSSLLFKPAAAQVPDEKPWWDFF